MALTPQQALQHTIEHREIFHDEMVDLMRQIMRGEVSPLMTAAIAARQQWMADQAKAGVFAGVAKGARWQDFADALIAARKG